MKRYILNFSGPLTEKSQQAIIASLPDKTELVIKNIRFEYDILQPLRPQVQQMIRQGIAFLNTQTAAGEPAWDHFMIVPPCLPIAAYWVGAAFVRLDMAPYICTLDPEEEDEHQLVHSSPVIWAMACSSISSSGGQQPFQMIIESD